MMTAEELKRFEESVANDPSVKVDLKVADVVGIKAALVLGLMETFGDGGILIDKEHLKNVGYFLGNRLLENAMNKLFKYGYIKEETLTETEIISQLKIKALVVANLGLGHLKCAFCSGLTLVLHKHHLSNRSTIDICANCHYEFHHLKKRKIYHIYHSKEVE